MRLKGFQNNFCTRSSETVVAALLINYENYAVDDFEAL